MASPKSQLPLLLGLTAAGGVGYYLYSAGGSPKAAEKKFEADLSKASAKVKGDASASKKAGEAWATEKGAKIDSAVDKARADASKTEGRVEQYAKDTRAAANKEIDAFDAKVEKKAAEAKSTVSGWFGGK